MGCVLGQHDETSRKEHTIYYLSKKFTDCESRYLMLEKTLCALAWDAKRLRQYMLTHTTLLISKMDPVKYIFERSALIGRVTHWQIALTEYDIQHVTQKALKGSVLSDYLAHQPLENYKSMSFQFPDKDITLIRDCNIPGPEEGPEPGSRWILVFYGAYNAHVKVIGEVITSPTNFHPPPHSPQGFVSNIQTIWYNTRLVSSALKLQLILGSKSLKSTDIQPCLLAKSKEIETLEITSSSFTRSVS
ncbi:uncharacterized protein LOC127122965 [Lathyrus oleraceus]|uniref:uncharacterized protein LOC127122965 n=1 Tax=Pisum sativum TaxID=3888 RepID=UPI0021D117B6|nr:uncharacterized protein LOC127122965 [Pisum sativum]